jgi:hypothetical protein
MQSAARIRIDRRPWTTICIALQPCCIPAADRFAPREYVIFNRRNRQFWEADSKVAAQRRARFDLSRGLKSAMKNYRDEHSRTIQPSLQVCP